MSNDLISREALKKAIEEYKYCGFYDKLIELIDNAPTVEVEPEKIAIANVSFDENKLKEIVQTEVIDKIKSGELVLKDENPQGDIFPMEIAAGKCPFEVSGNCPLRSQGEWIIVDDTEQFIAKCSICGRIEDSRMVKDYPFCHCGADMRKGGAE